MSTDTRKNIEAMYYLSPLQEGMLFHSLYAPESGVYVQQLGCTLKGDLNIAVFERAWRQVVKRHSTFRTAFIWEGRERMLQVVQREVDLPFEHLDWRDYPTGKQQEQLVIYLQDQRERGFKFAKAPLMRLALIRTAKDTYYFVWNHHNILLDGWSLPLVLKEVFAFYEAFSRGQSLQLPPPRPYGDYIAWLQCQDLAEAETFWRKTLKGFFTPTPLGVDRAVSHPQGRPVAATYAKAEAKVSAETTAALQRLARQRQLTLNTLVQGAWAILLSRYSGETDVVFGATVSGRPPELAGVETMVGLFINTLPARVQICSETALIPWLQSLQAQQLEIRQYEYSPLTQVQRWSEVPRGTQLFESLVVFENYPVDASVRERNTSIEIEAIHFTERTNYALTLMAAMPQSQLSLGLTYDGSRFDVASIERLLGHVLGLLESIAAGPERSVSDLSLLSAAEQRQMLVEWNATQASYPDHLCLHQLIEAQAARTPDAVAVVFDRPPTTDHRPTTNDEGQPVHPFTCSPVHPFTLTQVTYRELNRRANQLAGHLRALGVGPETRVAICLERSPEMLIGLLAILKAGAAYLPLDPTYPQQRLAFMLQDSQAAVLITTTDHRPPTTEVRGLKIEDSSADAREMLSSILYPLSSSWKVVDLCVDWPTIAQMSPDNLNTAITPDNLAYIIYTSGSTGRPKGVQILHRAVGNFLHSMRRAPGLNAEDTLLAVTTLSFDIAALELFLPLIAGARLVLVSRSTAGDGAALLAALRACQATVMQATPVTWRLLLAAGWLGDPSLTVLCGGEALPRDLATQLLEHCARVWNLYGPTETTIWSCLARVDDAQGPVPIGRPIANTEVYLLDAQRQPVPIGVPGELYIEGIGLARGYVNRPDLTAERFVPNPFSDCRLQIADCRLDDHDSAIYNLQSTIYNSSRLYKTGDLARYRPDGTIEFLGRIDHQVKVRGHRIELGEIEAVLREHPLVREALVVASEQAGAKGQSLVAYVSAGAGQGHLASDLRRFLQEQLPNYMLPSAFVFLSTLPRLPNGKVDHRRLPAPNQMHPELEKAYVAPRTRTETTLAAVWSDVLGVERVGIHDNFFDLGGHSLLATQILARIRAAFQVDLPLKVLFEALTVAELAHEILLHQLRSASREKIAAGLQVVSRLSDHDVQSALLARDHQRTEGRG